MFCPSLCCGGFWIPSNTPLKNIEKLLKPHFLILARLNISMLMMQFFSFTVFLRFLAFSEWKLAAVKALSSGLLKKMDWYQLNTDVMLDIDLHNISCVSLSMSKETCCKKVRGNAKRSCMFPFKATRRKKVKYIACIIFTESFNLNWLPAYLALYSLLTKKFLCPTKTKLPCVQKYTILFSTLLN